MKPTGSIASLVAAAVALIAPAFAEAHLALIRQGPEGGGALEGGDFTGWAVAAGDFDGDGFDDLAIGAPNDNQGAGFPGAGVVTIVPGTALGLTHVGTRVRTAAGAGGASQVDAQFGYALAAGDWNGDGFSDLAVGAPFEPVAGHAGAGRVYVLHGSASGLGATAAIIFSQAQAGGAVEDGDQFGYALASGDWNGDGRDDLAVGSPGEDAEAGAVFHLAGSTSGITTSGAGFFKQADLGGTNASGDRFGRALAAGNLIGSSHDDLAAGAPYRAVGGASDAGVVYVIGGSATGLPGGIVRIYSGNNQIAGAAADAQFGYALAAGRFGSDSYADLAIGEPGRTVGGAGAAGRVVLAKGSASDLLFSSFAQETLTQTEAVSADPEAGDSFGAALAAGDWDGDGDDDLAVASPLEDLGASDIGMAHVFLSGASGIATASNRRFLQPDLGDLSESGDRMGHALAFGRFDDSGRASLAIGTPYEDTSDNIYCDIYGVDAEEFADAGCVFLAAPWRQPANENGTVRQLACRNAVVSNCGGEWVYALRPFDRVRLGDAVIAMTALIACERMEIPDGEPGSVSPEIPYNVPAWLVNAPYERVNGWGLEVNDTWTLRALVQVALAYSAGDAANAVANVLHASGLSLSCAERFEGFLAEMNDRAAELGMTGTLFTSPSGQFCPGGYSTPADMERLCRAAAEDPLLAEIAANPETTLTYRHGAAVRTIVVRNDFLGGLRAAESRCTGVKSGIGWDSQICGLHAAEDPASGIVTAAGFGWRIFDGSPEERNGDAASLLRTGFSACGAAAKRGAAGTTLAELPTGSFLRIPRIPTRLDSLWGGGVTIENADRDCTMIDLRNLGTTATAIEVVASRTTDAGLGPGDSLRLGTAPFDFHKGFTIVNTGPGAASLRIATSTPSAQTNVSILPDSALSLPPAAGPGAAAYTLTVVNIASSGDVTLKVRELGYGASESLPGGGMRTRMLLRAPGSRGLTITTRGLDPAAGREVSIEVHDPGTTATGVDVLDDRPPAGEALASRDAWPNPFRGATRLAFDLAREGRVGASIYDVSGRLVRRLAARPFGPGTGGLDWDGVVEGGADAAPGIYVYRLTFDGRDAAKGKVVRMR